MMQIRAGKKRGFSLTSFSFSLFFLLLFRFLLIFFRLLYNFSRVVFPICLLRFFDVGFFSFGS